MLSLKEVRLRIETVKSTQQITRAMKMVAAAKLRKAQNAILALRPYAAKMAEIIQNISATLDDSHESVFSEVREAENILILVVSSNRGLCGPFNANISKAALRFIVEKYTKQLLAGNVDVLTIGKKGHDFITNRNFRVTESNNDILEKLTFESVSPFAERLMADFANKKHDRIIFLYNQFKNAAIHILKIEQFLPIVNETPEEQFLLHRHPDFIFEPSKNEIISELIPKSLKTQLYKILLDSLASEHGARMTAMHIATDNAQELLKELRLTYNKARQATITNEILEIVSGAEALK